MRQAAFGGPVPPPVNVTSAGKSAAQIFADTCNACHRSPREVNPTSAAFLREHYTTGGREAGLERVVQVSDPAAMGRDLGHVILLVKRVELLIVPYCGVGDGNSHRQTSWRGEGPLFAPLPPEEEKAVKVSLTELKGLPAELVTVLSNNGKKTLQDILDLEREEVVAMGGMTPDLADRLMAFLNELVDEGGEAAPEAAPEPTPEAMAEPVAEAVSEPASDTEAPPPPPPAVDPE